MDLIEVLWKQDVDLGYVPTPTTVRTETSEKDASDDIEKIKALLQLKEDKVIFSKYFYRAAVSHYFWI